MNIQERNKFREIITITYDSVIAQITAHKEVYVKDKYTKLILDNILNSLKEARDNDKILKLIS